MEDKLVDHEFKNEVSRSLNELRKSNLLCDTTIRAEGTDFAAHRCVLSAASLYFRALFTTEMNENESNFVELEMVKCATLTEVLQFIYTGEAKVDISNAQDLIMAADYLIIPTLKSKASEFLSGTICASNCLSLESFASQFNCESLKEAAVKCKFQHFVSVVKTEDFKSLDFDKVKNLISADEIIVSKEDEVYDAVALWVKHNTLTRECFFPELLKCVRLFSMSKYSLREIVAKEELVVKSPECMRCVLQGLETFLFPDDFEVLLRRPRLCLKSSELVVVLTGGHEIAAETRAENFKPRSSTFGFSLSTKEWLYLPKMPYRRSRHASAVCCGQLYVVGGNTEAPLCYFNPLRDKWFTRKETLLPQGCAGCSLSMLNEELYMIGGKDDHWHCVKKYSFRLNKWTELSPMQIPRAAHCAVVFEGLIYILAGQSQNGTACLKSVECYNPLNDQWAQIQDMIIERQYAAAAALSEKVFVVGGYSDIEFEAIERSGEIYDKSLNQWSLVSGPSVPRAACGIVSVENCVYLFGGEDENQGLDSVECYNVQDKAWSIVGTMPEQRTCLQASLLQLPTEKLQKYFWR